MKTLHTEVVADAHAYTRSKSPWILSEHKSVYGKLIHYISGGGMCAFGRTVHQEEVRKRHIRFIVEAAVFGVVWFLFLVF